MRRWRDRKAARSDPGLFLWVPGATLAERCGDFSTDDLTLGRLYEVKNATEAHGMVRIIDDSGEDCLYPASLFESVEVQAQTAARLH